MKKNIDDLLRQVHVKPTSNWQSSTQNELLSLAQNDVTKPTEVRTHQYKLSNLISLPNMSGKFNSMVSIISILATLTAGTGTVYASNAATPGDLLFSLDKAVESVQRVFTIEPVSEAAFELKVLDERIAEMDQLTSESNVVALSTAITEVEAQTGVISEQLKIMDQLRLENKLQTQEQQQIMEQLRARVQQQTASMQQTQSKLQSSGDNVNSGNIEQIQKKYSDAVDTQIQSFEESTGVKIETQQSQQNQGEDTQIQNQNQIQNQGESSGSTTSGSGTDQQSGTTTTPKQGGKN
jgi:hypothetical protein